MMAVYHHHADKDENGVFALLAQEVKMNRDVVTTSTLEGVLYKGSHYSAE